MGKIQIIAEIANAHQGQIKIAEKLALEAFKAKADVVKFQIYFAEELLVEKHPRFLHFKKQSFSSEEWINLINKTKKLGIKIFCDIFGIKALNLAKSLDVDGFKIHSSDLNNKYLLSSLNELDSSKEIIISCGGSNIREIYYALNILKNEHKITLMHGFQSYPTAIEDSNLRRLDWLKRNFGDLYNIGYQDHVAGENIFANVLPLLAIMRGAKTIEKHITLDRSAKGVDYYSSLEPNEFKDFVSNVGKSLSALGEKEVLFSPDEINYRNTVKKRIVSTKEMKKGEIIKFNYLTFKRTDKNEIETSNLENFVGKKLNKGICKEYALSRNDIEIEAWGMIIARTNSQRLNKKATLNICGKPSIVHLFDRVKKSKKLNKLILCTTNNKDDDILIDLAKQNNIDFYRGPNEDVLGRMLGAVNDHKPDLLIRITGDDILIDPEYIDMGITEHLKKNVEYTDLKELPSGTEVEIFDTKLLQQIYECTNNKNDTEYLTYYITKNREHIATNSFQVNPRHKRNWRLTLDNKEDLEVISLFLSEMKSKNKLNSYRMDHIVDFFEKNPEILEINKLIKTKKTALNVDTNMVWGNLKYS